MIPAASLGNGVVAASAPVAVAAVEANCKGFHATSRPSAVHTSNAKPLTGAADLLLLFSVPFCDGMPFGFRLCGIAVVVEGLVDGVLWGW